jgi:hypothetical protein
LEVIQKSCLSSSRITYTTSSNSPSRVEIDENRWTVEAAYGYELLHLLTATRTTLEVEAAAGWQSFDDAVSKVSAFPVGAGLRLGRPLSEAVDVRLDAGWRLAAGATDPKDASVFGPLKSIAGYGLTAGWRVAGGHRIEAGYRGELHAYEHDYRVLHLVGLKVGLGL